MNISQAAASRSRSVESSAFFREGVSHATKSATSPPSTSSPYAWKYAINARIWSHEGPPSIYAGVLLERLVDYADAHGRAWPGIQALLRKTKIKTERTLQKALDELVAGGWLRIVRQTWASLTDVQTSAGKRAPRRGDAGQATNLYVILDGHGGEVGRVVPTRPGLARTAESKPNDEKTPPQICRGGPPQKDRAEPPANLHPDPDQIGNLSREERVERASRIARGTHISSKTRKSVGDFEGWNVIVEAHTEKTKATYGLPPLPPDLKREQREALASLLDGAAAEVRAKLHARSGTQPEIADVRRDIAARVMNLYFKRDNEHLRRVKHALRDLPREFHARLTEAMQALLRESHDVAPPRRAPLERPIERIVAVDKPVATPQKKPVEEPKKQLDSADKPRQDVSMNTALEARRLLEALNTSPQQELFRPSRTSTEKPEREHREPEQARASADKPDRDKLGPKTFEDQPSPKSFEDKTSPRFERPLGRTGARRWGGIGPRPTKVRRANKFTPDEAEPKKEHGGGSTPLK